MRGIFTVRMDLEIETDWTDTQLRGVLSHALALIVSGIEIADSAKVTDSSYRIKEPDSVAQGQTE